MRALLSIVVTTAVCHSGAYCWCTRSRAHWRQTAALYPAMGGVRDHAHVEEEGSTMRESMLYGHCSDRWNDGIHTPHPPPHWASPERHPQDDNRGLYDFVSPDTHNNELNRVPHRTQARSQLETNPPRGRESMKYSTVQFSRMTNKSSFCSYRIGTAAGLYFRRYMYSSRVLSDTVPIGSRVASDWMQISVHTCQPSCGMM